MKRNFECARESASNLVARILHIPKKIGKAAFTLAEGATHIVTPKSCWKAAFTLAEVLITLGIIGVVAALTMPTLIQNHQKQVYVTGLKKAYSNLQNAFAKMAVDEGVTDWKDTYCNYDNAYLNADFSYEEWLKGCAQGLSKQFKSLDSGNTGFSREEPYCYGKSCDSYTVFKVKDGDGFISGYFNTNDGMTYVFACSFRQVYVDINGMLKAPNKLGRDVFAFHVYFNHNKILPYGYDSDSDYSSCTVDNINKNASGALSCTAKVLTEGKMDY